MCQVGSVTVRATGGLLKKVKKYNSSGAVNDKPVLLLRVP